MSRVAVVGAGIAGLAAAYALQEAGLDVVVLERADAAGGRMQTRSEQGFTWDAGAQFMLSDYRYMPRLLAKLSIPVSEHTLPPIQATVLPDGRLHYTRVGSMAGILRHPALSTRTRLRLGKVMAAGWRHRRRFDWYHPEKIAPIDTESLRSWGDREVGADAVDWLLSTPTSTLFFWEPEETPWWYAVALAWTVVTRGWRVFVPEGGMGAVTQALARRLRVHLKTAVRRVEVTESGQVRLHTEDASGRTAFEVDRAVIAVPAPEAVALLPGADHVLGPAEAAFLRAARYTANLTTAVAFDCAPEGRAYGVSVPLALGNKLAAIGWEHVKDPRRVPPGAGLAVLMPTHAYTMRHWDAADDVIGPELTDAAAALYPGSGARPLFHRVRRWRYAMPVLYPGWSRRLADALAAGTPSERRVFTCGDYWLGPTTESALVSGLRAAAAVLRSLARTGADVDELRLLA